MSKITPSELKKLISKQAIPTTMIWVDQNHTLVEHYLDQLSLIYNRKIKKIFSLDDLSSLALDYDKDNSIYLIYLQKKEIEVALNMVDGLIAIFSIDEEVDLKTEVTQITFGKISRNACLVFLENYVEMDKGKKSNKPEEPKHYISRELLERALDYFDDDLDLCMNEIKKVEVLELTSSWDHPFEACLNALPPKDKKLRSLNWFSGGDIDTCQVLYNVYIKKLKSLPNATTREKEIWAKLVKEAIWCELSIVSGRIGDYVIDYLRLVESSLPSDFKVQYFPPVFYQDLAEFPEWTVSNNKEKEDD